MTSPAARSRPAVNEDNEFFWSGIDAGELRIQRCEDCETLLHPPSPRCPPCGSWRRHWIVASGLASVYSHVTVQKPLVPPFDAPYDVAVVELAEGTRLVTQIVDVHPDEVHIGMDVQLLITEVEPGLNLPLFRPIAGT